MNASLRWVGCALTLISCQHTPPQEVPVPPSSSEQFDALGARFLEDWLARDPVSATGLGDHRYDSEWPDVSVDAEADELAWARGLLTELGTIDRDALSPEQRVDAAILAHQLEAGVFATEQLRGWEINPLYAAYTVSSGLDGLVSREFAPLELRMESLRGRLEGLPGFLAQARARLGEPSPVHTQTAIDQVTALVSWVDGPLRADFPDAQRAELDLAADAAEQALRDHLTFLQDELAPRSTGDFRIGRALWERKLQYSLDTGLSADQVQEQAWALLESTTEAMAREAALYHEELFPGEPLPEHGDAAGRAALIRKVMDRIADEHSDDDTIIAEARATLEAATAFVAEHRIVSLPDEPVEIIVMPEFKRGVSIAYCDAPGPLEEARETFYAIAPPPASWSPERRESFYREYNQAMLHELTIHEAMPGHFLQLAHEARFESPVRAVFSSGTFVEGWALYSEWMMAELGYGGPAVRLQRHKMVLRLCLNAIIDHGVHAGTMDHDEAVALMMERGFQEEGEAEGKWIRAQLTSAQLSSYLVGLLEVMALRRAYEAQAGDAFDLMAFNDELLAHGAPPPRHLASLLGLGPLQLD
jgi:uncharacterized protein (DUF885 family)